MELHHREAFLAEVSAVPVLRVGCWELCTCARAGDGSSLFIISIENDHRYNRIH